MAMTKKAALRKWNTDNPKDKVEFKEGKGRLSGVANTKLSELVANGWDIEGLAVSRSTTDNPTPVVVKEKATTNKEVIEPMPYRYDEKVWKAVSDIPVFGTTEFGMREVCWNTGNSLVGCYCPDHIIHGVPVRIVAR